MAIDHASQGLPSSTALPISSHRLPTVSATDLLEELTKDAPAAVSTGLKQLDALLAEQTTNTISGDILGTAPGPGLPPGSLVEIWGPSGSGKTSFATTISASTLKAGYKVIWIDLSTPLVRHRLQSALGAAFIDISDQDFHHMFPPSLAHLLALLQSPPEYLPWTQRTLLVIENLHHSLEAAYPRVHFAGATPERTKWAAGRRTAFLSSLASLLRRLMAVRAISSAVITANASTRSRGAGAAGAVLVPALAGLEWERALTARWVLFQDFEEDTEARKFAVEEYGRSRRFIGVTRLHGKAVTEDDGDVGVVLQFDIDETGIKDNASGHLPGLARGQVNTVSVLHNENGIPAGQTTSAPKLTTRKRDYDEIADSESDGDYGWGEEIWIAAEGLVDDDEDLFAVPEPDKMPPEGIEVHTISDHEDEQTREAEAD